MILKYIQDTSLLFFILFSITLGLSPFVPEPHIFEKFKMLFAGTLTKPLDIFDLLFHLAPWILLGIKLYTLQIKQN